MFYLKQLLVGHTQGARCGCANELGEYIVSGGFDGQIIIWKLQGDSRSNPASARIIESSQSHVAIENGENTFSLSDSAGTGAEDTSHETTELSPPLGMNQTYEKVMVQTPHSSIILCICASHEGPYFYSGGNDSNIFKMGFDGVVLLSFKGHTGPVCSIKESLTHDMISGSWDGTARVWCTQTAACKFVLHGHAFAVCCCFLGDGIVATGSQDKKINFWKNFSKSNTILDAHNDIVRSIDSFESGVVSVSNDEMIKLWLLDGSLIASIHGHESYIYDVVVSHVMDGYLFTASEDRYAKIWKLEDLSLMQSLLHEGSVWKVFELPNGDIVTCCEDGLLRIWTQDEKSALPLSVRHEQQLMAEKSLVESHSTDVGGVDIKSLPDISELEQHQGKEGQIKMFREGNKGIAYRWSSRSWERIGEIVASKPNKVYYEGDQVFPAGEYDYVFDVEIGDSMLRKHLPYNNGGNMLVTAENFCSRENLSKDNMDQIMTFLKQNTRDGMSAKNSSNEYFPASSSKDSALANSSSLMGFQKPSKLRSSHFPAMNTIKFDKTNWNTIEKRLLEINSSFKSNDPQLMDEGDIKWLKEAIKKLSRPDSVKQVIRDVEINLIFRKLATYSSNDALPLLDLWRAIALHPSICDLFKGSENGFQYISNALKHYNSSQDGALAICCLRFIANLFHFNTTKRAVLRWQEQILQTISETNTSSKKQVRIVIASIFTNFAVVYQDKTTMEGKSELLSVIFSALQSEIVPEALYRHLVAVGTLCANDASCIPICKKLNIASALAHAKTPEFASEDRIREAAADIEKLVYSN